MAYSILTIVMCEDDCKNCTGRTEAQIEMSDSNPTVAAAKAKAQAYAASAGMTACELRIEKRDSWYNDVWGWVGGVLLVLLIIL
jgi:hypothetical protein